MFQKIVYAADGSSHARRALDYTRELAEKHESAVIVVYAFEEVSRAWGDDILEERIAERVSRGEKVVEEALQRLREVSVETEAEVLEGPPAEAILKVAEIREANLIIMGTRGMRGATSLLLGSTSHRVMAHSPVPVMVVPAA
jgi:nucleotide-binding universal stress UspA family protein